MRIKSKATALFCGLAILLVASKLRAAPCVVSAIESEISAYADELSVQYKVPAVVIKSVIEQESRWNASAYNSGDGGIGLMQVTPFVTATKPDPRDFDLGTIDNFHPRGANTFTVGTNRERVDLDQLCTDWKYNMRIGVRILLTKVVESTSQHLDLRILENWYYPLAYYNGGALYNGSNSSSNDPANPVYSRNPRANVNDDWISKESPAVFPYQECVFNIIARRYAIPTSRSQYFDGRQEEIILPGPTSVQTGAGHYSHLNSSFRFPNFAEFYSDHTAKTGTTANPVIHHNVGFHLVSYGAGAINVTSQSSGAGVPDVPIKIDGVPVGSTDANAQCYLPIRLCGNHLVEAHLGTLHFSGNVNFVCSLDHSPSIERLDRTAGQAIGSDDTYQIEMESDGSCADSSPLNDFAPGNVVEVFGTGNGLRARFPDACGDSWIVMPDSSVGTIVGGPECCNGYIRWKIRYDDLSGIEFWSAEGEAATGQSFLRKRESGTCTYALNPTRLDLTGPSAASSGFQTTTDAICAWTAVPTQSWISITTNGSGPGSKQVTFSVSANTNSAARSGTIAVAGKLFTVTQPGTATANLPNLKPEKPGGWSDSVVVSTALNDLVGASVIYDDQDIFVNHASINDSATNITQNYTDKLFVDDVPRFYGTFTELPAHFWRTCLDWGIGTLSPGVHTIRVEADVYRQITESNENDNSDIRTITVLERPRPRPSITSALLATGTQGEPFQYQIVATNRPTHYGAASLPPGLMVSQANGLISGTPTVGGAFNVSISASNGGGIDTQILVLTISPTYVLQVSGVNGSVAITPNLTRYPVGMQVSLTPIPTSGYQFNSWSGDAGGNTNPLIVTMDRNKNIVAHFGVGGATNVEPIVVTARAVGLTWKDNSDATAFFTIERRIGGGSFEIVASIPPGATGWVDANVSPNTAYSYRVRGSLLGQFSEYSNEVSVTTNVASSGSGKILAGGTANYWAIETDAGNVYWSSHSVLTDATSIWKVGKTDGSLIAIATGLQNAVFAIAVRNDHIYWAESNVGPGGGGSPTPEGAIKMASIDGGLVTTLTTTGSLAGGDGIRGLKVDESGLYWVEAGQSNSQNVGVLKKLTGASIDNPATLSQAIPVILADHLPNPTALVVDNDFAYWIEYNWTVPNSGAIKKIPKNGGSIQPLATGFDEPHGIALDSTSVYTSQWNGAVFKVPKIGGSALNLGGYTRSDFLAVNGSNVYYSSGESIGRLSVNGGGGSNVVSGLKQAWGLATDVNGLYWSDGATTLPAEGKIGMIQLNPPAFGNVSTRLAVGTGDNVLIGGFIINGTQPKKIIVRAIGSSLAPFGLPYLADPMITLHDSTGSLLASNDNWQSTQIGGLITSSQVGDIQNTGLAPTQAAESAIIATLTPGAYTAIVRGVNNTIGIGMVEAFDLNRAADSKLANISTRGFVQTGDGVMIGGLIVQGSNPTKVMIRAIGPSLSQFGITNSLQDPMLELHDGNGALLTFDDNWRDNQQTDIQATGLAPSNNAESAILATLSPGAYTAIVRGKNATSGVALVEAYQLNN